IKKEEAEEEEDEEEGKNGKGEGRRRSSLGMKMEVSTYSKSRRPDRIHHSGGGVLVRSLIFPSSWSDADADADADVDVDADAAAAVSAAIEENLARKWRSFLNARNIPGHQVPSELEQSKW
ncbi:hypothetical protein V1478_018440, partial [Vespula squamosa]